LSARAWDRRRRNKRLWLVVRAGLKTLAKDPLAVVSITDTVVMVSPRRYELLKARAREELLATLDAPIT